MGTKKIIPKTDAKLIEDWRKSVAKDNTSVAPRRIVSSPEVNTTSEYLFSKPKNTVDFSSGKMVLKKSGSATAKRNPNANPGLIIESPEFDILSMGGGLKNIPKLLKPNIKKATSIIPDAIEMTKKDLSSASDIVYEFYNGTEKVARFTGSKNGKDIYVNGIEVADNMRRKGVASKIYSDISNELKASSGNLYSRSTQHQFTDVDNMGRAIAPAEKLWNNLVATGKAEKIKEPMSWLYKHK